MEKLKSIIKSLELTDDKKIEYLEQLMLDKNLPLIIKPELEITILHYACKNANLNIVKWLIEKFSDLIDKKTIYGTNILFFAAKNKNSDVFFYLWERYEYMRKVKNNCGFDIVITASSGKNVEILQWLIEKQNFSPFVSDPLDYTALHYAATYGISSIIEYLANCYKQSTPYKYINYLKAGLQASNPMHVAASNPKKIENIKTLYNLGMDLDLPNGIGLKPIHIATRTANIAALDFFHELKVNLNQEIECLMPGSQSIHIAAYFGQIDSIKWLEEHNIDFNVATVKGIYPIHLAAYRGHIDSIEYFIKHNSPHDLPTNNKYAQTILHIAASNNNLTLLEYLAKNYKFNFSTYDGQGYNLLHLAAQNIRSLNTHNFLKNFNNSSFATKNFITLQLSYNKKHLFYEWDALLAITIVENCLIEAKAKKIKRHDKIKEVNDNFVQNLLNFLINQGCKIEEPTEDEHGDLAVHIAAKYNNANMLNALNQIGADLTLKNKKNESPIEVAIISDSLKSFNFLLLKLAKNLQHEEWHKLICLAIKEHKNNILLALLNKDSDHYSLVHALLSRKNTDGYCPLHYLAHTEICNTNTNSLLIILETLVDEYAIDLNMTDKDGNTLMHLFLMHPQYNSFELLKPIISYLLENGAYPYLKNNNNQLACDVFLLKHRHYSYGIERYLDFLKSYGIYSASLALIFEPVPEIKFLNFYLKYSPHLFVSELLCIDNDNHLLKKAFALKNNLAINLLLAYGFAIGYCFNEEELNYLNSLTLQKMPFLSIGAYLITAHASKIPLNNNYFKNYNPIFTNQDINLNSLSDDLCKIWLNVIGNVLLNSSVLNLSKNMIEDLQTILSALVQRMSTDETLTLLRERLEQLLSYQCAIESRESNLSIFKKEFINLYQKLNKKTPSLSYLCIDSLLEINNMMYKDNSQKNSILYFFKHLSTINSPVKQKYWYLLNKFSLFPVQKVEYNSQTQNNLEENFSHINQL